MSFMWADTLLSAERTLLLRLLVWGALSVLTGTALLAWLRIRGRSSLLLGHFAAQLAAWGVVERALLALRGRSLAPAARAAAARLERILWLIAGLGVGYVLV